MSAHEATAIDTIEVHRWQNDDNLLIYNAMPLSEFRNTAINGGLENGCALDQIAHYIFKASSILEVGAGYGRVIANLLNKGYSGKLTAIERDVKLRIVECIYYQSLPNRSRIIFITEIFNPWFNMLFYIFNCIIIDLPNPIRWKLSKYFFKS